MTVCVVGTDGSGKTTLSERLAKSFTEKRAVRVWLGAESVLMRPVRAGLRFFRNCSRPGDAGGMGYAHEVAEKEELSRRFSWLHGAYLWLLLADYSIQYWFKMIRLRDKELLVFDRCFFDVAVNAAISLGWSLEELSAFVQRHCHRFVFPQVRIFLKVPPSVSLSRKDDIPDRSYLELRMQYYERLSRDFVFTILDGTLPVATTLDTAIRLVEACESEVRVHYVHSNNDDVGGADHCLFRMASEVARRGFSVSASLRLPNALVGEFVRSGVPVVVYPYCRPQLSRGVLRLAWLPFASLWSFYYFLRLFQQLHPSVIHVNDLYDFVPALASKALGIPVVYHIRMIRERALERRVFAWLIRRTAVASASVSKAVRETYFPRGARHRPGHRAEVIYDWPDDDFVDMAPESLPEEFGGSSIRVVMAGRVEPWKGQEIFVEAVSRLSPRPEGVGFFLIGGTVEGAEKQDYARKVLERAQEVGIVWLGERQDVKRLMQWADISIHASTSPDPFPGVVLESLLSESATIAADAGGVVEMIESGLHGVLVEPGDVQGLVEALGRLLADSGTRRRLAKAGRERISRLFRKEEILDQLEELYREVCPPEVALKSGMTR